MKDFLTGSTTGKLYFQVFLTLFFMGLIYTFWKFSPEAYSFFPRCPFHSIFGIDCPGCGSQRAIHSLLHGDILRALSYNLLLVLYLPLLFTHAGYELYSGFSGNNVKLPLMQRTWLPRLTFALAIIFWILRNIPFAPFSYLAA